MAPSKPAHAISAAPLVAILSLIGTATTGFLGMNLVDAADASLTIKVIYFVVVALLTTMLTVYTVMKASRLAEFPRYVGRYAPLLGPSVSSYILVSTSFPARTHGQIRSAI